MTAASLSDGDVALRVRDWRNAAQTAVCDVQEPWAHGTILRATRYPSYYDFNVVRVEQDPAMSVDALIGVADEALDGLEHRRVDFDLIDAAEPLRAGFEAEGWEATRLLWMRHEAALPPGPEIAVEEVPYDAVRDLRIAWHQEDFPGQDFGEFMVQSREVALARGAQTLAVNEDGAPVAFARVERVGAGAEITHVYVDARHRGGGRGTAITRAAVEAASDARDLWIVADDEDRPKELYARLGFRPASTTMEFTRLPRK